jgi:glycosyltransferase involved in cell wall biosynthesis
MEHFDARVNGARRAGRLERALGIERVLYVSADRGVPVRGNKGASVHVRSVVAALASAGVETRILTAREGRIDGEGPEARLVEARSDAACGRIVAWIARLFGGGEPLERAILRLLDNFWLQAAGRQIVSSWPPDLVYERYALTAFAGARIAHHRAVPFVLEVNSPLAGEERAFRGLRFGWLAHVMERYLLRRADRVVVVSRALQEWVVSQGVPPAKVLLLPNAGVASWSASETDARAIRVRHGLDDDAFVVGFCGSLKPWHGVTHLLEAATRVANTIPRLRLLFVGDGPERPALERRAAALGIADRVRFVGAVPHEDVPAHLAACDVLAAPYERIESFYFSPLKLAEYLQTGRPVLVSAVGDIPNMVDGSAQVTLLPPGDVEAIAMALARRAREGRVAAVAPNGSAPWTWNTVVARILAAGEEARRTIWGWTS